jgi:hypothetical protein
MTEKNKNHNKNLKQKNYALLGLLLALVTILFCMAIVKVDVSSALNMK